MCRHDSKRPLALYLSSERWMILGQAWRNLGSNSAQLASKLMMIQRRGTACNKKRFQYTSIKERKRSVCKQMVVSQTIKLKLISVMNSRRKSSSSCWFRRSQLEITRQMQRFANLSLTHPHAKSFTKILDLVNAPSAIRNASCRSHHSCRTICWNKIALHLRPTTPVHQPQG